MPYIIQQSNVKKTTIAKMKQVRNKTHTKLLNTNIPDYGMFATSLHANTCMK